MNDFFIGIELTRHCNFRCAHCFRADVDQPAELPLKTLETILVSAKKYHQPHIALTGGEPTLHQQFVEILELIISHGLTFHYVTNGYNHRSVFKKLYHLFGNPQWTGVSVSLDGATADVHDAIRGKGSFAQVLGTIAVARTHKLEVVTQMIVHRGNQHQLEALALLCSKLDVSRLHIAHMQPTPRALRQNLMNSPEECHKVEKNVADLQEMFRMPIGLSAGFSDHTPLAHCQFLKLGALSIDYAGRLTACCQLSNLAGGNNGRDIVADLHSTPLVVAHQKLLSVYQGLAHTRLEKIKNETLCDLDGFYCWTCMKHFGKVEWMRDYPDNEWVRNDPYFRAEGERHAPHDR